MRPWLALIAACLSCAASCSRAEADYPYVAHRVDEESLAAAAKPGRLPAGAAAEGGAAPSAATAPSGAAAKGAAAAPSGARRVDFPIAGTVSHHLLASICIDEYFAELASRRAVS